MVDARIRLPPLYLAACISLILGIAGLATLFVLHLPAYVRKGLIYTCLGFVSFGAGEIVNHPRISRLDSTEDYKEGATTERRRNVCSLGNLFDIGALLLFFIGLSNLLFRG